MSFLSNSSFGHKRPFSQLSSMRKRPISLTEIPAEEDFNKAQFKKPFEISSVPEDLASSASTEEKEIAEIIPERTVNESVKEESSLVKVSKTVDSPFRKSSSRTLVSRSPSNVNKMESNSAYSFLGNLIEREKEEYNSNINNLVKYKLFKIEK